MEELQEWCIGQGQTRFRGVQLFEWMYRHEVLDARSMTNIAKRFQDFLSENCVFQTLTTDGITESQSGETKKFLFRTNDNQLIESVSMLEDGRHTICVSSQIGCNVDCDFCATASMGFIRNLSAGEIVDQLILVRRVVPVQVTNIVFMGMGEPFLNYNRVMTAADIFHHRQGFDLASLRITISTSGILPGIKKFIEENRRFKLAVSLNATTDAVRTRIMPVNNRWPLAEVLDALRAYNSDQHRKIMFEYILMKGINDTEADARRLIELLKGMECKLNIIPYNETDGRYQRPDDNVINAFLDTLYKIRGKIQILVRWSKGQDIAAACGQLAVNNT